MNTFSFNFNSYLARPQLGFRDDLDVQTHFFQSLAYADSTVKSRASEHKALRQFCEEFGITHIPLTAWEMCRFSTWLCKKKGLKAHGSVLQYLSAASVYCKTRGVFSHTPSSCMPLKQVVRGMRRHAQRPEKVALPITPKILKMLLSDNSSTPLDAPKLKILKTMKSLALIYFLSMLRSSNLVPISRKKFDKRRVLTWGALSKIGDSIVIRVTASKTVQFNERIQEVPLAPADDPMFCPVSAISDLATMVGHANITADTPVFLLPTAGGNWTPLIKSDFEKSVYSRLEAAGIDSSSFTLHSFRRGGIQELLFAEKNKAICQAVSGHTSEAFMAYCDVPAARRLTISRQINQNLSAASSSSTSRAPLPSSSL